MLTEMAPAAEAPPVTQDLTVLLFLLFVHLADCERDIRPQEVRALQRLTGDRRWATHPEIRAALGPLGSDYARLWASYEAGHLVAGRGALESALQALMRKLPAAGRQPLRDGIAGFVARLGQGGISGLLRPGLATSPGRLQARAEVQALLQEELAMPAAPAPAPPPAPRPAAPLALAGAPPAGAPPLAMGLPAWVRGRTRVRCVSVRAETADVKSFSFVAEPACLFQYRPGQFVTFELPIEGRMVRRSYTISSSSSRPYLLTVTVKQAPGGFVSAWLHDNMHEGFTCTINGPHGDFSCLEHPAEKLLLISGGSGVTPMMSMLRYFADTGLPADIVFLNSVRTPADIIFEKELLYLSAQLGGALRLLILPAEVARGHAWNGPVGRLNAEIVALLAPDFAEREVFVCGPGGFMDAMRRMLHDLGHPPARFHQESFGPPAAQPAAPAPASIPVPMPVPVPVALPRLPAPAAVAAMPAAVPVPAAAAGPASIVFVRSGVTVEDAGEDCILDLAESHGVALSCSCRAGICGTCRVRVASGRVEMEAQDILSQAELAQGYVLSCITRAQGQVVLEA